MTDTERLHAEALANGYKDETCSRCGAEFLAHIHFIRCDHRPCPMLSDNSKSVAEMLLGVGIG
jgi:hypothetical protein